MKDWCVASCCLRIADYEAMLKHTVDELWYTAPSAAARLASLASLESAICGHPSTSQLVDPDKGPATKEHGTTVNPAMLERDSTIFA